METSDSYIVVEKMIRMGEVLSTELERLLDSLEEQGHISTAEHQALLKLAEELNRDHSSPP